ncbi:deoxyribodipyrimidine photo-lyase [Uliginosibacterium sp. sgz301328]|uniref:cryptochrome/photolyase family protein n=1 Tax=Uliginosibacterium sp. sgz301328 TaxID=3243764 RepID=UPI00359E8E7A
MPDPTDTPALVWFRRDLRDDDHAALYLALRKHARVFCAFVFDTDILDALPRRDRRVEFIRESLVELDASLRASGGQLIVRHGKAREQIVRLAVELGVGAVYANGDYEPATIERDADVARSLFDAGIGFVSSKDQVIFEKDEILTQSGRPFAVFTPYRNAWLRKADAFFLSSWPVHRYRHRLAPPIDHAGVPTLQDIGFEPTNLRELALPCGMHGAAATWTDFQRRIDRYHELRDFPARKGVSYLSVHLRFGTLSIRELARFAWQRDSEGARAWLSELIWRDFYQQILYHHPHVVARAFRPEYDSVQWLDNEAHFRAWCEGRTGYPIVDAAMRQLNQTGYMHNRLRMITASFLTKDLGIHWLRGERYFAQQLNDYDLAANNGGWQWAASTGCDAQPWFRIFNPVTQSRKFDPDGDFIRRYVPELTGVSGKVIHAPWAGPGTSSSLFDTRAYPPPIVDHDAARKACLARFSRLKPHA